MYYFTRLTSDAFSGEAVPQEPVGSLCTPLSNNETGRDKPKQTNDEAGGDRPRPMLEVADVKPPAIISSVGNKEDQAADNAAAAVVANTAACECGKVKQTCSASGCQQQYCRNCALNANEHDDFTFCSSYYCCGNTMYCGDHFHLVKACCHCDEVMCRGDTQECPYCEEMLCQSCANEGEHELECCADHCNSQSISS